MASVGWVPGSARCEPPSSESRASEVTGAEAGFASVVRSEVSSSSSSMNAA
ncbi:hypothetical protein ACFFX0_26550 [Citricoccus parietis]|uniref:Uncharacterized protein n=1 Tax=Citricoccus parietis TaxID=592307 RepID=A0ABV5G6K2_9MICC